MYKSLFIAHNDFNLNFENYEFTFEFMGRWGFTGSATKVEDACKKNYDIWTKNHFTNELTIYIFRYNIWYVSKYKESNFYFQTFQNIMNFFPAYEEVSRSSYNIDSFISKFVNFLVSVLQAWD